MSSPRDHGSTGSTIYLHGRGDAAPGLEPGESVRAFEWRSPLILPVLGPDFCGMRFADQISMVDGWTHDGVVTGLGHSYGSWVLLALAEERQKRGQSWPFLILMGSLLGCSRPADGPGFIAPRARKLRVALGLDGHEPSLARERISFVFGADDTHTDRIDVDALAHHYEVHVVEDTGHRLDSPRARALLRGLFIRRLGSPGGPRP